MSKKRGYLYSTLGGLLVAALGLYVFAEHTSTGRVWALYMAGGFHAPNEVKDLCRNETDERVTEKFLQPLDMNGDARTALREYWHYSYYRQCLYRAGYSFMGSELPSTTLTEGEAGAEYRNPLAGLTLALPRGSTVTTDNELNVTYDARLLHSELDAGASKLVVDVYTSHQFVNSYEALPQYIDHFVASTTVVASSTDGLTAQGSPYLYLTEAEGTCRTLQVSPEAMIISLIMPCDEEAALLGVTESTSYFPATSLHE
jgi:hypothetical protein